MERKFDMGSSELIDNFFKKLESPTKFIESSVIVVGQNGEILRESLENKPYNHGILTNYMAMKLGCDYLKDNNPFLSGINLKNQGYVVMQIDADCFCSNGVCLCFFPDLISNFQISSVIEIIKDLQDVCYQYLGNSDDNYLSYQDFVLYVSSLRKKCRDKRNFKD